jgi:hypothetical protein
MSAARWIICTTPDCPGKFTSFDYPDIPSFRAAVADMGWKVCPAMCPDCVGGADPTDADPAQERILVVPLPCGAFTAYAPADMTRADWATVQGICGAMARGQGDDDGGG